MGASDVVACPHCGAINPASNLWCSECKKYCAPDPDAGPSGTATTPSGSGSGPSPPQGSISIPRGKLNVASLRCPACSAPLHLAPRASTAVCDYCGMVVAVQFSSAPG